VVRALTPDAPPWRGIVEEGFPVEAVTNPMLWYKAGGDPHKMREHLARMIASVRAFLDIERVESHPLSEYRIPDSALTSCPLPHPLRCTWSGSLLRARGRWTRPKRPRRTEIGGFAARVGRPPADCFGRVPRPRSLPVY